MKRYPVVGLALLVGVAGLVTYLTGWHDAARIGITTFVALFCLYTLVDMVKQLLRRHFGLDILALVAMIATLAVGEYWASLVIVIMLSGGEALEDYAARRASKELTSLLDRSPTDAHLVIQADETKDVPVDEVHEGDVLIVRPSEVVPVDCLLLTSLGSFDMSSVTGESLPVTVISGEEIPSGVVNGASAVKVKATRPAKDSQYQQIVKLVAQAQQSTAPVVRVADRFALPFTAIALIIGGAAWLFSGDPVRFAEVLVLATPCPLLIAAPVAFMGGMSRAAKHGVVVKGGAVIETASRTASLAFDKTGTLTSGDPQVVRVVGGDRVLAIAASAEQYSSHVLAQGIRNAAQNLELPAADSAVETSSQGILAHIDGQEVRVGRAEFVGSDAHVDLEAGEVAVYVSVDHKFIGAVILSDSVRPETKNVVDWLKASGISTIAMVTGDAPATASAVGHQVGITQIHASLRPADKVEVVANLQPKPTMMVGDGVNDAPVLAAANVGVAMGAKGSTAAGEAADAVILRDSLSGVVNLISISRHTMRVALTAIWLGVILSVVLMLIATTGVIPAIVGALGQEVLDLVAILYALRALGGKLPRLGARPPETADRLHPVS